MWVWVLWSMTDKHERHERHVWDEPECHVGAAFHWIGGEIEDER